MAHLKLGVTLKELGYEGMAERLSVWLTNSLEESVHEVPNLFMSQWLTQESNEASKIKSEMPIMVVVGNPPYSVSSANKGEHIQDLIADYKKDLNEKKINLDDDYIKFIRYAEHAVEQTGYGVVAMITNNSFIDGLTHRQMRKQLTETFDEIYIFDLHGSVKKKELGNVFDIQQGVSINIFIKNNIGRKTAIYHTELDCSRDEKFDYLLNNDVTSVTWEKLEPDDPYHFWVPKNLTRTDDNVFSVSSLFKEFGNGIGTDRDKLFYDFSKNTLSDRMKTLFSDEGIKSPFKDEYKVQNSSSYPLLERRLNCSFSEEKLVSALYRPFDERWFYYDQNLISRPAPKIMNQLLDQKNVSLLVTRQLSSKEFRHVFVSDVICDRDPLSVATKERTQVFPLYLVSEDGKSVPNLNLEIWENINDVVGETKPENILDYIYSILYSPNYREKYKEFLKIDFPRIPYPTDKDYFWKLVELGKELRELHLLKSPTVNNYVTSFPEGGNNMIEKKFPEYRDKNVHINAKQYFGNIPKEVWEFCGGGYQPAQKWLKDRRERVLTDEEIEHYQQMIVSISETIRVMKQIDKVV